MSNILPSQYSQPVDTKSKSLQLAHHLMDKATMGAQFSRRFEQLLRSEKYYDCVFHIGGVQYKCHKLILSTASPVFEAMFYGPMCEKQQQQIEILDISPDIFQVLINYIYAGAVNFDSFTLEEAIELYYCAEKYLVDELATSCLLAITRKLRYANILPALELCVCMDLCNLLEVCMSFFARCCLNNPQFMTYHKNHYMHISRECIKSIIAANKGEAASKQLLWFVYEWCQQECHELDLPQSECALIIDELKLFSSGMEGRNFLQLPPQQQQQQCNTIERSYFKACRPFTVTEDTHEWSVFVKCNRFIALRGLILSSRLTPNIPPLAPHYAFNLPSEYNENLRIEITAPTQVFPTNEDSASGNNGQAPVALLEQHDAVIWQHNVIKQITKYNCDLNINWGDGLLLTPEVEYRIKLVWRSSDAYGSEYPCSLQSDFVDGIQFRDFPVHSGSPVKGLRFLNLV